MPDSTTKNNSNKSKKTSSRKRKHAQPKTKSKPKKQYEEVEDIQTPSAIKPKSSARQSKKALYTKVDTTEKNESQQQEEPTQEQKELKEKMIKIKNYHLQKKQINQETNQALKEMEKLKMEVREWMDNNIEDDPETGKPIPITYKNHIASKKTCVVRKHKNTINDVLTIVKKKYGEKKLLKVIEEIDRLHTNKNSDEFEVKFSLMNTFKK